MYTKTELASCLFFDIETIPIAKSLDDIPKALKKIWLAKHHFKCLEKETQFESKDIILSAEDEIEIKGSDICTIPMFESVKKFTYDEIFIKHAALYPEFSRVISIAVGGFSDETLEDRKIGCLYDEDEKKLLEQFQKYLDKRPDLILAGYNIKSFDIPFLTKRYYINDLKVPMQFQTRGKKPWEVHFVDTCEDWKGLMWESISLDLLCNVLDVPSPKDKFQNYEFTTLYYNKKISVDDVKEYPSKDVNAHMSCCVKLISK